MVRGEHYVMAPTLHSLEPLLLRKYESSTSLCGTVPGFKLSADLIKPHHAS